MTNLKHMISSTNIITASVISSLFYDISEFEDTKRYEHHMTVAAQLSMLLNSLLPTPCKIEAVQNAKCGYGKE